MIQNYKCNEIKINCSEFSHTIDATFLKIRSALSHAFIANCFRSEISLDLLLIPNISLVYWQFKQDK